MDELIGVIKIFAGTFPPRGWAFCQGQILSIAQNTALFSILGTTYGGNGQTTFALPDLRGRTPIAQGTGPGLTAISLGQMGGTETVTLNVTNLPAHNHSLNVSNTDGNVHSPNGTTVIGAPKDVNTDQINGFTATNPNTSLNPASVQTTGGNQPHENREPYLGVNYIICLEGIYPSRN